jgi:octaprenyl-diphosphate synthase
VDASLREVQERIGDFFTTPIVLIDEVSRHLLSTPGKKFRPTLLLLVAGMKKEPGPKEIRSACVLELIHTATLIHDDSVDKSYLRRGIPTVNSLWDDQVSIIMGDYLYTKAFHSLLEDGYHDVAEIVARCAFRMSIGEMLQIEQKSDPDVTEEAYDQLIQEKTASLISASCEVGALLGWGPGENQRRMAAFGTDLGMAYQITDDLFDYVGDERVMGKEAGSDLREGKITAPLIRALRNAPAEEAARMKALVRSGEALRPALWSDVLGFVEKHRGLEESRQRALGFAERARTRLLSCDDSPHLRCLLEAVDYAVQRDR